MTAPNTPGPPGVVQTELRNERTSQIDVVSTLEMCQEMINNEDAKVAAAVQLCLPEIARTIDLMAPKISKGGRVIYIGAGTNGSHVALGPPTFSAPYSQFVGLIAGGDTAIRKAVEGAEDSMTLPIEDLSSLSPSLDPVLDTLIGIALVVAKLGCTPSEGRQKLDKANGSLRAVF